MADASNEIQDSGMKSEALKLCKEFLGGPWKDLTLSQFRFSSVSGGLSNTMYLCALPEGMIEENSQSPKEVLLRIYGPLQDEPHVIVTEATTFMLLAEKKLGPKLYGVFPKGRLEEFIPSRTLLKKDYRQFYKQIARELAKIHALNVPVRKVPDFFSSYTRKWMKEIESETILKTNKSFNLKEMYEVEIDWIAEEIKKRDSPVMYCHNDLQGGNILLREDSLQSGEPKVILIDFEFGAYNYRDFDLANQFIEWCFDYNTGEFPFFTVDFTKFPSKEEQTSYIRAYLEQLVELGVLKPSCIEKELETILQNITIYAMAANLMWSLWSEKMSLTYTPEFAHIVSAHREHGKTRRKFYWALKEQLLQTPYCNGVSNDS